jgi:pimeloyl-ACP methyl ester carboxylesterase
MKQASRGTGRMLTTWLGLALLALFSTGFGRCGPRERELNPIVFVHGGSGSGAQFESQAMRFTSNGYRRDYIAVVEYNSVLPFPDALPDIHARIDARIAELQARTGRPQVDLIGHSRGTTVSHDYLSFPDRAANVAHYVNIDGRSSDAPPGGVPTLALWAGAVDRPVQGEIVGAVNVTLPNQEHVQAATSEESFFEMYSFLRGHPPSTTRIRPQIRPRISGRVVVFPDNVGVEGATVNVWWVRSSTAERILPQPSSSFVAGPDGEFGPFHVWYGLHYEFEVLRDGQIPLHFFYEPFLRSDHLVRLNTSSLLEAALPKSDANTGMGILRYKEFWGDRGAENDVLAVNGTDVINPVTAPSGEVGVASVGFFVLDAGPGGSGPPDGVTNLTTVPFPFTLLPFLTGTDLFLPTDPPDPISIVTVPRGDVGAARILNVRNIPSTEGLIQVQLRDFER